MVNNSILTKNQIAIIIAVQSSFFLLLKNLKLSIHLKKARRKCQKVLKKFIFYLQIFTLKTFHLNKYVKKSFSRYFFFVKLVQLIMTFLKILSSFFLSKGINKSKQMVL